MSRPRPTGDADCVHLQPAGPCSGTSTPRADTFATWTQSRCSTRCPACSTSSIKPRPGSAARPTCASDFNAAPCIGNRVHIAPSPTRLGSLPHSKRHARSVMPPVPRSNESVTGIDRSVAPRGSAASARPAIHARPSARWTGTISGEPAADPAIDGGRRSPIQIRVGATAPSPSAGRQSHHQRSTQSSSSDGVQCD